MTFCIKSNQGVEQVFLSVFIPQQLKCFRTLSTYGSYILFKARFSFVEDGI